MRMRAWGLSASALIGALALAGTPHAPAEAEDGRAVTVTRDLPVYLRMTRRGLPRDRSATLRISVPLRTGDGRTHTHRIAVAPDGATTSNIAEILNNAPAAVGPGVALQAETFWLHRVIGLNKPVGVPLPRLKGE